MPKYSRANRGVGPSATLAGRGNRLLAFVIDNSLAIVGAPLLRTVIPPGVASSTIITIVAGLWLLALAITQIILLGMRGQSIGKYITKAAIVDQFYAEVQAMGGRRWDTSSLIARLDRE